MDAIKVALMTHQIITDYRIRLKMKESKKTLI